MGTYCPGISSLRMTLGKSTVVISTSTDSQFPAKKPSHRQKEYCNCPVRKDRSARRHILCPYCASLRLLAYFHKPGLWAFHKLDCQDCFRQQGLPHHWLQLPKRHHTVPCFRCPRPFPLKGSNLRLLRQEARSYVQSYGLLLGEYWN